jgi:hypothetical protein
MILENSNLDLTLIKDNKFFTLLHIATLNNQLELL